MLNVTLDQAKSKPRIQQAGLKINKPTSELTINKGVGLRFIFHLKR